MKKISTKLLPLIVTGAMLLTLASCGGDVKPTSTTKAEPGNSSAALSSATEKPGESGQSKASGEEDNTTGKALKIAIVSSPSGVDDGSFNQDNYNGILSFIKAHPDATVTPVQEPTGAVDAAVTAVADIVGSYDVIVCCGFQFSGIGSIASDNPDVKFILVDANPVDEANETVELENVYAMTFAEQESGFFAGIAAALETKTNKVAVVNGVAYPSNVNYQWGFEAGVNYANMNLATKAELVSLTSYAGTDVNGQNVGGNYVGSFNDVPKGKVLGKALIDEGCDIIFVAAGASGNGVFAAVKEATNVMVIGCDVDQYDDGENNGSNVMLTSALKVMSLNVDRVLTEIVDGTFKGGNFVLGADTDSTGIVKAEGRNQLQAGTLAQIEDAYLLVQDKTIVPPSNFGGTTSEDFPGLKAAS